MSVRPYVLQDGEGTPFWFAGALMVLKAGAEQTGNRLALLDQFVPADYAVPVHVHHDEDEAWYILDGAATFYCGDERFTGAKGAWVFLPKGVAHSFRVTSAGARLLTLTVPAQFADFVRAAGEPAPSHTLPPAASEADVGLMIARMTDIAARFGIELLGPPPAA